LTGLNRQITIIFPREGSNRLGKASPQGRKEGNVKSSSRRSEGEENSAPRGKLPVRDKTFKTKTINGGKKALTPKPPKEPKGDRTETANGLSTSRGGGEEPSWGKEKKKFGESKKKGTYTTFRLGD